MHTKTYRTYMAPLAPKSNVNKHKDAVLSHNCIKLIVVHIELL